MISGLFRKLRKFDAEGFVELSNIGSDLGIVTCGLRNLAAIFFGVRISKKEQLTNWERPDLNSSQCLYAATDAWICLKMFRFSGKRKSASGKNNLENAGTSTSKVLTQVQKKETGAGKLMLPQKQWYDSSTADPEQVKQLCREWNTNPYVAEITFAQRIQNA